MELRGVWCVLLTCLFYTSSADKDFFTSIGQMTDLLYTEKDLVTSLKDYIRAEESKLEQVKKWAEKLDVLSATATQDPEGFLGHPVNAFKLMKRLNTEWGELESLVLKDMSDGTNTDVAMSPMTVEDCFELGKIAYSDADYYHTELWMEQALKQLDGGEESNVDMVTILDYLSYSIYQQGELERALDYTKRLLKLDSAHQRANGNLKYFEYQLAKQKKVEAEEGLKEKEKREREKREAEIEKVKELAKPRLRRATISNPITGVLETAHYRISKSAWLTAYEDPVVDKINQRIEDITGLNVKTAEELQVANYGVGGQYEPHFDFGRKDEPDAFKELGTGNRIATWLIYMSDVPSGGATVFTDVGAAVWPKKGSAVFWYNLFASGEGDYSTRHAACPVLVGNKWVSNKWIHERGQEFRRRCTLD
ncbi:unnamed protein product, partial [Coregonus sp. 'balchen']